MTNPDHAVLIGITGQALSGKDTVSDYLVQKHGFFHISLGDIIRDYIKTQKIGEPTRPTMQTVGNQLRHDFGPDVLAKWALKKIPPNQSAVISGIRTPHEAQVIKSANGKFWVVTAPVQLRYQRALARQRIGDNVTFEEFQAHEKQEQIGNHHQQNLSATFSLADNEIENNSSLEELYKIIDVRLASLWSQPPLQ